MNADPVIITSTNTHEDSSNTVFFPLGCVPISGQFHGGIFHASDYTVIIKPRATIPEHVIELRNNMNRGVRQNEFSETIARAIWERKAIMGTDGSVRDPVATYSFVISISRTDVKTSVKGGRFLPPTAHQYLYP
jgi:hypothetical protein